MTTRGCVPVLLGILLAAGCGPTPKQFHEYGLNRYNRGDYVGAIAMFKAALESGPERPDTLYCLGECYRRFAREKLDANERPAALRHLDTALLYYNLAIESHPGHAPALRAKADVLELKGRTEDAIATAEWAGEQMGNVEQGAQFYLDWAQRLEARKDYDAAKLRYEQAVAVDPYSALAHARLGGFYERLGDHDRAVAAFRQAYRLKPDDPGILRALRKLGYAPADSVAASSGPDVGAPD